MKINNKYKELIKNSKKMGKLKLKIMKFKINKKTF